MTGTSAKTAVARAQRFDLRLPMRFRAPGDSKWRGGLTCNVSRSGLLFLAQQAPEVGTPLELSFALRPDNSQQLLSEVWAKGRVVRTMMPVLPGSLRAIGAEFLEYRFQPRQKGPGQGTDS